jgi:hypothetical protein
MNFPNLIRELGPATVAAHVVAKARDCPAILAAAARHNPLVPVFHRHGRMKLGAVFHKTFTAIKTLCQKKLLVLAHPEFELVEVLCAQLRSTTLNIMVDATLPTGALSRLRHNFPLHARADIIQLPNLPELLHPDEAMILAVGAHAGGGWVLLPEQTLDALAHLRRNFWGEVVLIDPVGHPIQARSDGWIPVDERKYFTGVASAEGYMDLEVAERSAA